MVSASSKEVSADSEINKERSGIKNEILRGLFEGPHGARILIVDPGQYRAAFGIGMLTALEQAGIHAQDFDHIIVNSSGSIAGMNFALGRMEKVYQYCTNHTPSETLQWRDVGNRSILKVEKLLAGTISGSDIRNPEEWYTNPCLPPDYHAPGKKNPVIHIVTTSAHDHHQTRYIRSDRSTPEEFQTALAATFTIPRWSEPVREINEEPLLDGWLSDPVMWEYATSLAKEREGEGNISEKTPVIVKIGNSTGNHLEIPSEEDSSLVKSWLDRYPNLVRLWKKTRPSNIGHQMEKMYVDHALGKARVLFAEPLPGGIENPLLGMNGDAFVSNMGDGMASMVGIINNPGYTLPDLRGAPEVLQDALEGIEAELREQDVQHEVSSRVQKTSQDNTPEDRFFQILYQLWQARVENGELQRQEKK